MLKNLARLLRFDKIKYAGPVGEKNLLENIDRKKLPRHIAIIMDGNGRWAVKKGLPRTFGHRAGVESLRDVVKACSELGVNILTVYAFSTENWKRPREEVNTLMDLLVEYVHKEIDELCEKGVKVNPIGRINELPPRVRGAVQYAVDRTKENKGLVLNLALNYGGRAELADAVLEIARAVSEGTMKVEDIGEETISSYLYTAGQPDPDLLIRPAGDFRVSNFLLWQLAYTEFWFTPVLWPDFRRFHLFQAIVDYQSRERRFGGLKKS